jgi:hypothetical protein
MSEMQDFSEGEPSASADLDSMKRVSQKDRRITSMGERLDFEQ